MKLDERIARRSRNIASKKPEENQKEKRFLKRAGNSIKKQMSVDNVADDEILPIMEDSHNFVDRAIFLAELATTNRANRILFQFLQGIVILEAKVIAGMSEALTTEQVNFKNKVTHKRASPYTQVPSQQYADGNYDKIHINSDTCYFQIADEKKIRPTLFP